MVGAGAALDDISVDSRGVNNLQLQTHFLLSNFERKWPLMNLILFLSTFGVAFVLAVFFRSDVDTKYHAAEAVRRQLLKQPFNDAVVYSPTNGIPGWIPNDTVYYASGGGVSLGAWRGVDALVPSTVNSKSMQGWGDVEDWLRMVFAPTLNTGQVGALGVVQSAVLTIRRGALQQNESKDFEQFVRKTQDFNIRETEVVDFGERFGSTYGINILPEVDRLKKLGWFGSEVLDAALLLRVRDGYGNFIAATLTFRSNLGGAVRATLLINVVTLKRDLPTFACAALLLIISMAYAVAEIIAMKKARRICRAPDGPQISPQSLYWKERWFCVAVFVVGFLTALVVLTECILGVVGSTGTQTNTRLAAMEALESSVSALVVAATFLIFVRSLAYLTDTSIFFLVICRTIATASGKFIGVIFITILLMLGAAMSNYILLGSQVTEFNSYGDSIFYTLCLIFGAPLLYFLPPASVVIYCIGVLVCWVVFLPMLITLVIHSVMRVLSDVKASDQEVLGEELLLQAKMTVANFLFCCTPEPPDAEDIEEERARARVSDDAASEQADIAHNKLDEQAVKVSRLGGAEVKESRKLAVTFAAALILFCGSLCLLGDSPQLHREYESQMASIQTAFRSLDPFNSATGNVAIPPLWMTGSSECNPSPMTFPATQPQGVFSSKSVSRIQSFRGIYDWLGRILGERIFNAAYRMPTLSNAIPLTNPAVVLNLRRLKTQCQPIESLKSLYPLRRVEGDSIGAFTTEKFGAGYEADIDDHVYRVPIFFTGRDAKTVSNTRRLSGVELLLPMDLLQHVAIPASVESSSVEHPMSRRGLAQTEGLMAWDAADFETLYGGTESVVRKVEALEAGGFLDYQMYTLDVIWLQYNGDSKMYSRNQVRFKLSGWDITVEADVGVVPYWLVEGGGFPTDIVLLILGCICFVAFLVLSYRATKNKLLPSILFVAVDIPILVTLCCYLFFYYNLYNLSINPGWTIDGADGIRTTRRLSTTDATLGHHYLWTRTVSHDSWSYGDDKTGAEQYSNQGRDTAEFSQQALNNAALVSLSPVETEKLASLFSALPKSTNGPGFSISRITMPSYVPYAWYRPFSPLRTQANPPRRTAAAGARGSTPSIVPGPVQPWQWMVGSSGDTDRSEPPPSAESYPRFSRIEKELSLCSTYYFYTKICAAVLLLFAVVRCVSLVTGLPYYLQEMRTLLEHLMDTRLQLLFTSVILIWAFFSFCFAGFFALGSSYAGFRTPTRAIMSCLMILTAKWNFNSIVSERQQGTAIDWTFEAFLFFIYDQLKMDDAQQIRNEIQVRYGVVDRRRLTLRINDGVLLHFKALVKTLQLREQGVRPENRDPEAAFASLKDDFFYKIRNNPVLAQPPTKLQDQVRRSLLATQLVRIQQCLTDLEFLRAKQHLVLRDLDALAKSTKTVRRQGRKMGDYAAGVEGAIGDVTRRIEEMRTRQSFLTYTSEQDPLLARQQLRQDQLLGIFDYNKTQARKALFTEAAYIPREKMKTSGDRARKDRVENIRHEIAWTGATPVSEHDRRQRAKKLSPALSHDNLAVRSEAGGGMVLAGSDLPTTTPLHSQRLPGEIIRPITSSRAKPFDDTAAQDGESSGDNDWDIVREKFGGERQATLEVRDSTGGVTVVHPAPEPRTVRLPSARIRTSPINAHPESAGLAPLQTSVDDVREHVPTEASQSMEQATDKVSDFKSAISGSDRYEETRPETNDPELAALRMVSAPSTPRRPRSYTPPELSSRRRANRDSQIFKVAGVQYKVLQRKKNARNAVAK